MNNSKLLEYLQEKEKATYFTTKEHELTMRWIWITLIIVAINMMYSDYYKPSFTTDNYASMAASFLNDKDAPSNKLVRYMTVMK